MRPSKLCPLLLVLPVFACVEAPDPTSPWPLTYLAADAASLCAAQSSIPQAECDALVDIYNSTDGPNWTKQAGWLTEPNPCAWEGVGCYQGNVYQLSFQRIGLSGELPASISQFSGLRTLSIIEHGLTGIAPEIGLLPNLRFLTVGGTGLSAIPPEIGDLPSLQYLAIWETGQSITELPDEWGNLENLFSLTLFGTYICRLPSTLGQVDSFHTLHLLALFCPTLSTLPPGIEDLQITSLEVWFAPYLSAVQPEIGQLTSLQQVSFSYTFDLPELPEEFWSLPNLKYLSFQQTQNLTLPSSIGSLGNLESLSIHSASISELPADLGSLPRFQRLSVTNTPLTSLPESLSESPSLQHLVLGELSWSELPSVVTSIPTLTVLSLHDFPNFSGQIEIIDPLTNLTHLGLSQMNLESVPESISGLHSLRSLNLYGNFLSDLPEFIGSLPQLEALYLADNQLTDLPESLSDLTSLMTLYLQGNQLSGPLTLPLAQWMGALRTCYTQPGNDGLYVPAGAAYGAADADQDGFICQLPVPQNTPPVVGLATIVEADEGSPVTVEPTELSDPDGDEITLHWEWGDGVVEEGPSTTRTFTDNLEITLSVTASDGIDESTASTTVRIHNVAPTIGTVTTALEPVPVGALVSLEAGVTDPGSDDTHTFRIQWGDGTVSTGEVVDGVSADHTYLTPGVYEIRLTVEDDDGGSHTVVHQYVVVYDPAGGFTTGAGWIDADAADCATWTGCDEASAGKAVFGFVSKYSQGAITPDGHTMFKFKAGGLDFGSTEYQWLVANQAGTHAQFKGKGTVSNAAAPNGEDYGFMIWAGDGTPDTFRIKIWWEDGDAEHVVFDNGSEEPIGAGQITVHN